MFGCFKRATDRLLEPCNNLVDFNMLLLPRYNVMLSSLISQYEPS